MYSRNHRRTARLLQLIPATLVDPPLTYKCIRDTQHRSALYHSDSGVNTAAEAALRASSAGWQIVARCKAITALQKQTTGSSEAVLEAFQAAAEAVQRRQRPHGMAAEAVLRSSLTARKQKEEAVQGPQRLKRTKARWHDDGNYVADERQGWSYRWQGHNKLAILKFWSRL